MSPARLRTALATAGLAAVSIGIALGAAELGLRAAAWLEGPPPAPAPLDPELAALPELRDIRALTRANVRGRRGGVLWRTNSLGLRGPEVSPAPAPGTYRIALIGDSYTAGFGVAEPDTYAARLGPLLAASDPGGRFEVLNLGVEGMNARQLVRRAARLVPRLDPQLVVYGLTLNDIFEGDDAERRFEAAQHDALQTRLRGYATSRWRLVRVLGPRWLALRQALAPESGDYGGSLAQAWRDPEQLARIGSALDAFAALGAKQRICVAVLIHTELAQLRFAHPFAGAYAEIERLARERGLPVVASFPAHRGRDSAALRLSALDGHPNAEGHAILAEALAAGLHELPPNCRFPAQAAR